MGRVIALFSGADTAAAAEDEDWSASLLAVRGVAARVREMQKRARDSVREAQRAVRDSDAVARAAEDRARHAEATMREAVTRAERADRAEARATEAHMWLRRMHECMVSEFGALAAEPTRP